MRTDGDIGMTSALVKRMNREGMKIDSEETRTDREGMRMDREGTRTGREGTRTDREGTRMDREGTTEQNWPHTSRALKRTVSRQQYNASE